MTLDLCTALILTLTLKTFVRLGPLVFNSETLGEKAMHFVTSHKAINQGKAIGHLGPMLPETERLLRDFYQPFVRRLAAMTGDDKFLWTDLDWGEKNRTT